ncbi:glycoside hydrolase superfamily [Mycena rebaudengoi]|nr:glycoside hydrolase superfamily [Mycena rebaudengoi]
MLASFVAFFLLVSQCHAQAPPFGQCGGQNWTGETTCTSGWTCTFSNPFYSQCLQGAVTTTTTSRTTSVTTTISTTTTAAGPPASAPTVLPSKLVGKTPALGWNSWNAYHCSINEANILAAANQFVSLGLKAAGYQYINIDDCWSLMARNSSTKRIVHSLGLKFDGSTIPMMNDSGSLGFETIDAATFNEWGVDYLKYDNCNVPGNWSDNVPQGGDWYDSNSAIRYRLMTAALAAQSRPVEFNLCLWGNYNVWLWGAKVGHSWRLSGGTAFPTWSFSLSNVGFFGHGDQDMMEIGNGNLTIQEQRTHFAAWIMLKSPILLGTNLSLLNSTQLAIIKNAELLAFHQDTTIGAPGCTLHYLFLVLPTTSPPEYYAGQSVKGTHVFIINLSATAATKTFTFSNVPGLAASTSHTVHDMWTGVDATTSSASFSVTVQPHDTAAYFIK